jgi:hypothetical protein
MNQPGSDAKVLSRIERLVSEEHSLFEQGQLSPEDRQRLDALKVELDQFWDLLRRRRALREFGGDASHASLQDEKVIRGYIG